MKESITISKQEAMQKKEKIRRTYRLYDSTYNRLKELATHNQTTLTGMIEKLINIEYLKLKGYTEEQIKELED